ncbi:MAG: DUF2911 domain-containing protein [Bacteroidetes bacterium]|nr:DUF2911 domain-containing protein [Bacteroidota bacterium]MCB0708055.1 DUF2911 domain-containing protein [Chitinophagaceae bacterium]
MNILKFIASIIFLFISYGGLSQVTALTSPPNGGNKKAMVGEVIGITAVNIYYDKPHVKGREGKIYGTNVVHYGFKDLGFGTSNAAPWRAGANENTTIDFSTDVFIDGKSLTAGKYGFFIAMYPDEAIIIFSKNSHSWGSFYYDANEDALRDTVKIIKTNNSTEWLKYEFENETDSSANVVLSWEKIKIPFTISVNFVNTQIESYRKELRFTQGLSAKAWMKAAQFCVNHNTNLDEGLRWADHAINANFIGEKTFESLSIKASILEKLGRLPEAEKVMEKALSLGDMVQINQYGRLLIAKGKNEEALKVFQINYRKHPNDFTTLEGMVRSSSASNNFKSALKYAKLAMQQSVITDEQKKIIEGMVRNLKEGKDVN